MSGCTAAAMALLQAGGTFRIIAHYKTFSQLATITRVSYFRLRPLDAEETCVGNSKGAAAVVGNAGNNAAGLPAGHTDTSGRGSGSRAAAAAAVVIVGSRSRKMGRSESIVSDNYIEGVAVSTYQFTGVTQQVSCLAWVGLTLILSVTLSTRFCLR